MNRLSVILSAVVLVLAGAAGIWFGRPASAPLPPMPVGSVTLPPPPSTALADETVTVYVSGAVAAPGLVHVRTESRVADVIAAAGGALPRADLNAVNLAAPVLDGQHVSVPERGRHVAAENVTSDGKVAINQAGVEDLQRLPGVGPVLAEKIYAYREAHGPFRVVEDLLDVPGIGEGKLAALRDAVVVP